MADGFQYNPRAKNRRVGEVAEQPLTYSPNASAVVGAASAELVAADAGAVGRVVEIYVSAAADTGIHVAFGEAATVSHWFIPAGASKQFNTTQQIRAIRANAADVTVYVLVGKVA